MSRIRANQITNQSADGAPTVQNGLVISGVATSTTFSGSGASLTNIPSAQLTGALPAISGANLTGITQTTINNNGSNRIITGSGTANTLEGESTFIYDGTSVATIDTSQTYATFRLDGNAGGAIEFYENGTRRFEIYGIDAEVALYDRDKGAYHTRFKSGGNLELSDGKLLIGTTSAGNSNADDLTVANSGEGGITIRSGSSSNGNIFFSDATSGAGEYAGIIDYKHGSNAMTFGTSGAERLRINSSGQLLLGTSTPGAAQVDTFTLETSGHTGMTLFSGTSSRGTIAFGDGRSGNAQYRGVILYEHSNDSMRFATADTTQMNISSTGQITKPYQASFAAMAAQNSYSLNGQVFPFNTTTHNIGSHFNTSNYRFTAPVAGRYLFTFYSILNSSGQGRYEILINGAADQNGTRVHMTPNTSNWDHVSTSWILNLAANDYIQMYSNSNTGWHGGHWQRFCGELLS